MTTKTEELERALHQLHGVAEELRPWRDDDSDRRTAERERQRFTRITTALANALENGSTNRRRQEAAREAHTGLAARLRATAAQPRAYRQLHATRERAKILMQTLEVSCGLTPSEWQPETAKPWPETERNGEATGPTLHLTTAHHEDNVEPSNTSPALTPVELAKATVDHCRDGVAMHPTAGYGDSHDCRSEALWVVRNDETTRHVRISHDKWGMHYSDPERGDGQSIGYYNRRLLNDGDPRTVEGWLAQWAEHARRPAGARHRLRGERDGSYTAAETAALFGNAE